VPKEKQADASGNLPNNSAELQSPQDDGKYQIYGISVSKDEYLNYQEQIDSFRKYGFGFGPGYGPAFPFGPGFGNFNPENPILNGQYSINPNEDRAYQLGQVFGKYVSILNKDEYLNKLLDRFMAILYSPTPNNTKSFDIGMHFGALEEYLTRLSHSSHRDKEISLISDYLRKFIDELKALIIIK
jgi:hypothetical protein